MKLKFKVQPYQSAAVDAVVDCFAGQQNTGLFSYRLDPGRAPAGQHNPSLFQESGFRNAELQLSEEAVLANIQRVQRSQNLRLSDHLVASPACRLNLDVEMETGTGKTYCYIKTMFELHRRYGWSKFIIVVPSIAIREGVYKSLEITADHFAETYNKKARFFIYNSRQLHQLESFASDAGISVMVINMQAFASQGAENRRIYEELDDFQSRKPIDVISSNRPILILDEPQKMEGRATLDSLQKFKPLMILRYSATHRTEHNKIHRLDALDAYNQKLVKKIAVRGIAVKGLAGTAAYLYLDSIEISRKAPVARIEIEVKQGNGIKRVLKRLQSGCNLFDESNELDQYKGFVISQIDATLDTVEFTNGERLQAGHATRDVTEDTIRRIQIRETIKAHLDKERQLYSQGIKVLSLFFIDEVAKYRDYAQPDEQGEYARMFEQEYGLLRQESLDELELDADYKNYLQNSSARRAHSGYFSIDKRSKRLIDPSVSQRGETRGLSEDIDAYDLILKNKELLLSFVEPVRFIFSHSALREGWDNPNVFVMCMLKHSDNSISRRQEVGRGLRLAVNQKGDRMDNPATVHHINVLTVVASESYQDFVGNLQREISESLSARPRKADVEYFTGKVFKNEQGEEVVITEAMAKQLYRYLVRNDYTDADDKISEAYLQAKANGTLAALPPELASYQAQVTQLIDSVYSDAQLPDFIDDRKPKANPLNGNFHKKEFQALWQRINHKAIYRVDFETAELIKHAVSALDNELKVTPLQYLVVKGEQKAQISDTELDGGKAFGISNTSTEYAASPASIVKYDLIGKLGDATKLTRKTIAAILQSIQPVVFAQYRQNPEHFLAEASRLINEQKASIIIEKLAYDETGDHYDASIFTAGESRQDFTRATAKLKNHIYDYAITDSNVERQFVNALDVCQEIVVYAKLPRGFLIPTPVGDYNPDWAISFKEGAIKQIYFVAETKGSMSSLQLSGIEERKVACARKFFDELNRKLEPRMLRYDVVDSFEKLMSLVGGLAPAIANP